MSSLDELRAVFRRGDDAEVLRLSDVALADARASGDVAGEVESLYAQARVALRRNDVTQASVIAQRALDVAVRAGDRRLEERPRHVLAAAARLSGDFAGARELYLASIELNRSLGLPRQVRSESYNLAFTELRLGHDERARELLAVISNDVLAEGDTEFMPYLGIAAAAIASSRGDHVLTARLIGFTEHAFSRLEQVPDPDDAQEVAAIRDATTSFLGYRQFETEARAGSEWTPEQALGTFSDID